MGINFYNYRRSKEENKKLIEKYPWLDPRRGISDEDILNAFNDNYNYSYTILDDMPNGWNYTFGEQMCEEIAQALKEDNIPLKDYRVLEVKEKYGTLHWYDFGGNSKIDKIIDKYENLSKTICANCGLPSKYCSKGWILYLCENCFNESGGIGVPVEWNQ